MLGDRPLRRKGQGERQHRQKDYRYYVSFSVQ